MDELNLSNTMVKALCASVVASCSASSQTGNGMQDIYSKAERVFLADSITNKLNYTLVKSFTDRKQNSVAHFKNKKRPNVDLYRLEIVRPDKTLDIYETSVRKGYMYLPVVTKKLQSSQENDISDYIEFYIALVQHTDAEYFVIVVDDDVYRVHRSILLGHNTSVDTDFGSLARRVQVMCDRLYQFREKNK